MKISLLTYNLEYFGKHLSDLQRLLTTGIFIRVISISHIAIMSLTIHINDSDMDKFS